ncbi:MAG: putative CoA-binding protein [Parasphingorhabdus sp.]|jgi:predicted CoA-binding protein
MIDDIAGIRTILQEVRTIAVVGLSANWYRPSFFAAKYLQEHGYKIIPVNPRYESVLGETCYPNLESIPEPVDVVDLFQRSESVPPFVDSAINIGAKIIWLQLGVHHSEAIEKAETAGLKTVSNRCMKIEHGRLLGGLSLIGVNTGVISSKRPTWFPHSGGHRA